MIDARGCVAIIERCLTSRARFYANVIVLNGLTPYIPIQARVAVRAARIATRRGPGIFVCGPLADLGCHANMVARTSFSPDIAGLTAVRGRSGRLRRKQSA